MFIDFNAPPAEQAHQAHKLIQDFSSLLKHPAWLILDAYLAGEESRMFTDLQNALTGDVAMKATGAYSTMKNVRGLPERILQQAVQQVNELTKK